MSFIFEALRLFAFETRTAHHCHMSSLQIRKYIIQAQVLRDSWPLSKNAWDFVTMLKSLERLEVDGTVVQILSITLVWFPVV